MWERSLRNRIFDGFSSKRYDALWGGEMLWIMAISLLSLICLLLWPFEANPNFVVFNVLMTPGHVLVGAVFYLGLAYFPRQRTGKQKEGPAFRNFLITNLILAIIELIQPYFGRQFQIQDLVFNNIGILLAWILVRKRDYRWWFRSFCLALCLASILPSVYTVFNLIKLQMQAPILLGPDSGNWFLVWHPLGSSKVLRLSEAERQSARDGYVSDFTRIRLKEDENGSKWAGLQYQNITTAWDGYQEVCLKVRNANEAAAAKIILRFDDHLTTGHETAATVELNIGVTWENHCIDLSTLTTPDNRRLDLARLRNLLIFMQVDSETLFFDLGSVYLSNRNS